QGPVGPPLQNAFSDLIARNDPYGFARSYPFNVAPVTDNSPFLFFTLKTRQVLKQAATGRKGIDWKVNLGVVILLLVLLISIAAVLAFLILPLVFRRSRVRPPALPLAYFVAIGLGYMLVEITFIQRLVLFLGNPTYAITVVIFLLLLSSSAGSWASQRWFTRFTQVKFLLAAIVAALLIEVAVLPRLLTALVGLPFALKLAVSAIVLVPIGFAMGTPFPNGLRQLTRGKRDETASGAEQKGPEGAEGIEWAWAMNAGSSVLGSVLAMVIAVHLGLAITLACGAAAYLAALILTPAFPALKG
ncbi:MAG: hypothetical protein ACRD19_11780, partial [Terriglobia bacterium]